MEVGRDTRLPTTQQWQKKPENVRQLQAFKNKQGTYSKVAGRRSPLEQ